MKTKLKLADILGLGLMVFSFFLGAGNLIFPPIAGQLAGYDVGWALLGFVASSVLFPFAAVIAVALGGSLPELLRDLPKGITLLATLLVFSLMGPLFVTPRTGLVVYDMVFRPLLTEPGVSAQFWIIAAFFATSLFFCWHRGALIDNIGKIVTPVLLLLLIALAVALVVTPLGSVQAPLGDYVKAPFAKGIGAGYQTMDAFGSLMFGMLILDVLRSKGITDPRDSRRYLIIAGGISTIGLAFVYLTLFWLGATSATVAPQAESGGVILSCAVQALFGDWGQWLLGAVVILACLTTAVGLLSAFADYLANLTAFSYRFWVTVSSIISALVANVGLSTLTQLSQPPLFAIYPLAVALVALTLLRRWLPNPTGRYRTVMGVTLIFSLLDALRVAGVDMRAFAFIPGFSKGLGWVVPLLLVLIAVLLFPGKCRQQCQLGRMTDRE